MSLFVLILYLVPLAYLATWRSSALKKGVKAALLRARLASIFGLLSSLAAVVVFAVFGARESPLLGIYGLGFSLRLDGLSVLLLTMVSLVGFAVLEFSRNYLDGDKHQAAFLDGLSQTLGLVTLLLLSNNLFQLFFAWVTTSLALQKLLMFYPDRVGAQVVAKKKFFIARLSDFCLLVASISLYLQFETAELTPILSQLKVLESASSLLFVAVTFLTLSAFLKSAIFPTHGWLIEVMETPTPVSALLHAGLINAGVFLVVRFSPAFQLVEPAMNFLVLFGGFTALFAASAMLTQSTIKVSLAYSSAAHMGFMLLLCGLGAFSIAVLHLVGHSFYKAHAFLSSGSIVDYIKALNGAPEKKAVSLKVIFLSLVFALAIFFGVALLFGVVPWESQSGLTVTILFSLAIMVFLAQASQQPRVLLAALPLAILVTTWFYGLEIVGLQLLKDILPTHPRNFSLLPIAVIGIFSAVGVAQLFLPSLSRQKLWTGLYVHLKNGLYANILLDRLSGSYALVKKESQTRVALPTPRLPGATLEREQEIVKASVARLAPLWPLDSFVAVNPFLGLKDMSFEEAAFRLAKVSGASLLPPRKVYRQAMQQGRLRDEDFAAAVADVPEVSVEELRSRALGSLAPQEVTLFPTVTSVASAENGIDWERLTTESVSRWAAGYFDSSLAKWKNPFREGNSLFAAWKAEARIDQTAYLFGLKTLDDVFEELPDNASDAIHVLLTELEVPEEFLELYLHRVMMSLSGWMSYSGFLAWRSSGTGPGEDLLAILLSWECAYLRHLKDRNIWREALYQTTKEQGRENSREVFEKELLLLKALECGAQRELLGGLGSSEGHNSRPWLQAVFCIDVRSERYRNCLENEDPGVETHGFAGFFGIPLSYKGLGHEHATARCPVLLSPQLLIKESIGASTAQAIVERRFVQQLAGAWRGFKWGAVSCFLFVGAVGMLYLKKLITNSLRFERPLPLPGNFGLRRRHQRSLQPTLESTEVSGLTIDQQVSLAEDIISGIGLSDNIAPLVLFAGHASSSANNLHASGLDCGACGGHGGEVNAVVAARIFNNPEVRASLRNKGIPLPDDTVFLAAVHNTTTDELRLLEVPEALQREDAKRLEKLFKRASEKCRGQRAPMLKIDSEGSVYKRMAERSIDWSQVRPEWGLAGCAAFIAAPRHRSQRLQLGGRAFLHSYDWKKDEEFKTLELIMCAPMIVASWINLQYYGSTVDNQRFGSGNKTLHNAVSTIGVLEGNGGDLRVGLPWQSVHNGEQYMHDPVRLSVAIEAPLEALTAVILANSELKELLDHGWIHLFRMDEQGKVAERYVGDGFWKTDFPPAPSDSRRIGIRPELS